MGAGQRIETSAIMRVERDIDLLWEIASAQR